MLANIEVSFMAKKLTRLFVEMTMFSFHFVVEVHASTMVTTLYVLQGPQSTRLFRLQFGAIPYRIAPKHLIGGRITIPVCSWKVLGHGQVGSSSVNLLFKQSKILDS